jgi:hypothetical protein
MGMLDVFNSRDRELPDFVLNKAQSSSCTHQTTALRPWTAWGSSQLQSLISISCVPCMESFWASSREIENRYIIEPYRRETLIWKVHTISWLACNETRMQLYHKSNHNWYSHLSILTMRWDMLMQISLSRSLSLSPRRVYIYLRSSLMYMYVLCTYIYAYICTHIYMHMYIYIYICTYIYAYICTHIYMHMCIYIYI